MQDMGAGRDLGECCGSVETRFGLGWRANWCSDHPLGALSYIFSGQKKKGLCSGTPQDIKNTQNRAGSWAQGVKSTSVS